MPKVEITLKYTPREFREKLLDKVPRMGELYDSLVESLVKHGFDEREAEAYVAQQFLNFLNQKGLIEKV